MTPVTNWLSRVSWLCAELLLEVDKAMTPVGVFDMYSDVVR